MKRWLITLGSLAAGFLLCLALVARLDVQTHDWAQLLRSLSGPWIGGVVVLTGLLWWSGARKWAVLAVALHGEAAREPKRGFFLRHFAWQNWIGQFVPPALAIVAGRSWAARHMEGVSLRAGAGNAVFDQAVEFILLAGLLPAAWLVLNEHKAWTVWVPVAVFGMAGATSVTALLCRGALRSVRPFLGAILGWSALRVLLTLARLVVAAPALGLAINLVSIAAAAPVVALLALLPLTPGNLGLAEWGWTGVLIYAGTDSLAAGLYALGFRLLMFAVQSVLLMVVYALPQTVKDRPRQNK